MKDKGNPDMQQPSNKRQSNKMTPRETIMGICTAVMVIIATVTLTNSINVSSFSRQKTFTEENTQSRLKNHETSIVQLKEIVATVPVMFQQVMDDITELKQVIKDIGK